MEYPTFGICASLSGKRPVCVARILHNSRIGSPHRVGIGELVVRDSPSSSHQAVVGRFCCPPRARSPARAWGRVGRTARCRAGRGEGAHRPARSVLRDTGSSRNREKENPRRPRSGRRSSLATTESRRLRSAARLVRGIWCRRMLGLSPAGTTAGNHHVCRRSSGSADDVRGRYVYRLTLPAGLLANAAPDPPALRCS